MKFDFRLSIIAVFLLFMMVTAFADSPPPPPSKVTVHLEKNGQSVTTIAQIRYNCHVRDYEESNEVLNCIQGNCDNDPDQYARIYCAYFPYGNFSYEFEGRNRTSENFNNSRNYGAYYDFSLDVSTGKIKQNVIPDVPKPSPVCFPSFVMGLAFIGGIFLAEETI